MQHTIIIWKKLKERDSNGKLNFQIKSRYRLTQEEIEAQETEKYNEGVDDELYEYYAEIEETKH
jgi:hypothetical protein